MSEKCQFRKFAPDRCLPVNVLRANPLGGAVALRRPEPNFRNRAVESETGTYGNRKAGEPKSVTAVNKVAGREQRRVNSDTAEEPGDEPGGHAAGRCFHLADIDTAAPAKGCRPDLVVEGLQGHPIGRWRRESDEKPSQGGDQDAGDQREQRMQRRKAQQPGRWRATARRKPPPRPSRSA